MSELVSIIMPCYNVESYMRESVNSVIAQTYANWELIVVDDCSTDNTCELMQELSMLDDRIKISRNSANVGGAQTRNNGIDMASGRYIAYLDSDDLWVPEKLSSQIEFMESNNIGFTYSNYRQFCVGLEDVVISAPEFVSYDDMIKCNFIGCLTVVYDTKPFGKFYFPLTKKRHDYALWLNMLKRFKSAHNVGGLLARYRVHSNSLSAKKVDAFQSYFYVLYNLQKLNFFKSIYYTSIFSILSFFKKKKPKAYFYLASKLIREDLI